MKKFDCPLPFMSLSLDSGLVERVCCHQSSFQLQKKTDSKLIDQTKKEILNNEIPKACSYCLKLEKLSQDSPRLEYLHRFGSCELYNGELIKYLDITLDNLCNLECLTCSGEYSSRLEKRYEKMNIKNYAKFDQDSYNKNIQRIKDILRQKLDESAHIQITGGEPSLLFVKNDNFLTWLIQNFDTKNMSLRLFTNLTTPLIWLDGVRDKFKAIDLVVSLDAVGDLAHFVRYPSRWSKIKSNLEDLMLLKNRFKNIDFSIHSVVSVLNFFAFDDMIEEIIKITNDSKYLPKVTLLEGPKIFSINSLSQKKFDEELEKLKSRFMSKLENSDFIPREYINNYLNLLSTYNDEKLELELFLYLKKMANEYNIAVEEFVPYLKAKRIQA